MKALYKRRKWICVLLAIVMTISGMCFEPFQTDSSLCCIDVADASNISYVSSVLEKNSDICTGELLGISKPQSSIVSRNSLRQKNNSAKLFAIQSLLAFLPKCTIFLLEAYRIAICNYARSSLQAIIRFIHHQDGAKG